MPKELRIVIGKLTFDVGRTDRTVHVEERLGHCDVAALAAAVAANDNDIAIGAFRHTNEIRSGTSRGLTEVHAGIQTLLEK